MTLTCNDIRQKLKEEPKKEGLYDKHPTFANLYLNRLYLSYKHNSGYRLKSILKKENVSSFNFNILLRIARFVPTEVLVEHDLVSIVPLIETWELVRMLSYEQAKAVSKLSLRNQMVALVTQDQLPYKMDTAYSDKEFWSSYKYWAHKSAFEIYITYQKGPIVEAIFGKGFYKSKAYYRVIGAL